jgi:hypothetical protein
MGGGGIGQLQLMSRHVQAFGQERQEQRPGIAIGPDRRLAQGALVHHVGGEVLLQDRREQGHQNCPPGSRRRAARAATSGAACRYQ